MKQIRSNTRAWRLGATLTMAAGGAFLVAMPPAGAMAPSSTAADPCIEVSPTSTTMPGGSTTTTTPDGSTSTTSTSTSTSTTTTTTQVDPIPQARKPTGAKASVAVAAHPCGGTQPREIIRELPRTGSNNGGLVAGGLTLLALGGVVVLTARRAQRLQRARA